MLTLWLAEKVTQAPTFGKAGACSIKIQMDVSSGGSIGLALGFFMRPLLRSAFHFCGVLRPISTGSAR